MLSSERYYLVYRWTKVVTSMIANVTYLLVGLRAIVHWTNITDFPSAGLLGINPIVQS